MSRKSSRRNLIATFLVVLGLVIVVGLIIGSQPDTESTESVSQGKLTLSEDSWDLGDVSMKDGIVKHEVEFKNSSDGPVTITSMETSCMCTTATLYLEDGSTVGPKGMVGHGGSPRMRETIAPGEQAKLEIAFDPNAHGPNATGPIKRTVELETLSDEQSNIKLTFLGNVIK